MENKVTEIIKEIRKSKGITQLEMAEKVGMTQGGYQAIESNRVPLTLNKLAEIAEVFGMSVIDIINYPNVVGTGQDSERVKELEKRIRELEEWINDKREIAKIYDYNRIGFVYTIIRMVYDLQLILELFKEIEKTDNKDIINDLYKKIITEQKRRLLSDAIFDELIKLDDSWYKDVFVSEFVSRRLFELNEVGINQFNQIKDYKDGRLVTLED